MVREAAVHESARAEALGPLAIRLAGVPAFGQLGAHELELLAQACDSVRRPAGATLVRAGREGPGLCLILGGVALVRLPDREVQLRQGQLFGEIGLLTGWPATATVVAKEAVELAVLRWTDLAAVLARNPELGWHLLETLSARSGGGSRRAPRSVMDHVHSLLTAGAAWMAPVAGDAASFHTAFPDLRTLPPGVAEALVGAARPTAESGPRAGGLYLANDGLGRVSPLPSSEAPRGWRLTPEGFADAVAQSPDVVRFLARRLAGEPEAR